MAKKLYKLQPEHEARFSEWRDKWIKNAMAIGPLAPSERERVVEAVEGLYTSAGLKPPPRARIIWVPSPFVGAFTSGFASAIWYLHKRAATEAATRAATWAATWAATEAATKAATGAATGAATVAATEATTWAATRAATVAATVGAATGAATEATTDWYTLGSCSLKDIRDLAAEFGPPELLLSCSFSINDYRFWQGGNQWSGWVSYLSFFRHVAKLNLDYSKWDHYEVAALAGPRWMHEEFCLISERPDKLEVDDLSRPHCDDGPFCVWPDGSRLYAWHGAYVPGWILENPELISVEKIKAETNAEIKRIMVEKYGAGNYMRDSGAKILDVDTLTLEGSSTRALMEDSDGERWLVGSDGSTGRCYHMAVPRSATTCKQAHNLIAGFDESRLVAEA